MKVGNLEKERIAPLIRVITPFSLAVCPSRNEQTQIEWFYHGKWSFCACWTALSDIRV